MGSSQGSRGLSFSTAYTLTIGQAFHPLRVPAAVRPGCGAVAESTSPVPAASITAVAGTQVPFGKAASLAMISNPAHMSGSTPRSTGQRELFDDGEGGVQTSASGGTPGKDVVSDTWTESASPAPLASATAPAYTGYAAIAAGK